MNWLVNVPPAGIIYRQLYFLQLENYNLSRFVLTLPASYRLSAPMRQEIVWTAKMALVANAAFFVEIVAASAVGLFGGASALSAVLIALLSLVAFFFFHFVFLIVAVILISPLDTLAKRRIVASAREKLAGMPVLTVVAVAGSYGKTTMKEALVSVLSRKFRTLATPGNVNTPVGISRVILADLVPGTEVFIVEMGEHYPGDLAALAKLAAPDIAVVTGANEAHLERFGTMEQLIAGIFEAVTGTKETGRAVLNADDARISEHAPAYVGKRTVSWYSSRNDPRSPFSAADVSFRNDGSGFSFTLREKGAEIGRFTTPLLGAYAIGVAEACVLVGRHLGMRDDDIERGFKDLKPVPHRLQVVPSENGILVIDDSYNGNPEGARAAVEVLGRFSGRRKIYVTPGLVESGAGAEAVHRELGRALASVADVAVLIRNSVTPFIADELVRHGFPKERIHWFSGALEAHAAIPEIVKPGDVILFQNDWPDNYA